MIFLSSLVARGEEQGIRPVAKKLRLSAKWAKNTIPCGEECPPLAVMEKNQSRRSSRSLLSSSALNFSLVFCCSCSGMP